MAVRNRTINEPPPRPMRRERSTRPGRNNPNSVNGRNSTLTRVLKTVTILTSLIAIGIGVFFHFRIPTTNDQGTGDDNIAYILLNPDHPEYHKSSASRILKKYIEFGNTILLHQLQIQSILHGERVSTLLKTRLRPIQERVASLRTQTSQYEKMQHVPGGPTSFIASTLEEIQKIEDEKFVSLDQEIYLIISDENLRGKSLLDGTGKAIVENGYFTLENVLDDKLTDEGIYLDITEPLDKIDNGGWVKVLLNKYKLDDVIATLEALVPKLEIKEATRLKLNVTKVPYGDGERMAEIFPPGEAGDEYWACLTAVKHEVDTNGTFYQLFTSLQNQVLKTISDATDQLLEYALNKSDAYLKLKATIQEDVQQLKTRVQNLRYKYAKIPS